MLVSDSMVSLGDTRPLINADLDFEDEIRRLFHESVAGEIEMRYHPKTDTLVLRHIKPV